MAEAVYFERGCVRITSARAIFGGKTYAMATVTSVETRRIPPDQRIPGGIALCGLIACVPAAVLFAETRLGGAACLVVGLGLVVTGIVLATRVEPTWAVVICTAAGELQAYTTPDTYEIRDIVAALNDAIGNRE